MLLSLFPRIVMPIKTKTPIDLEGMHIVFHNIFSMSKVAKVNSSEQSDVD